MSAGGLYISEIYDPLSKYSLWDIYKLLFSIYVTFLHRNLLIVLFGKEGSPATLSYGKLALRWPVLIGAERHVEIIRRFVKIT